MRKNKLLIICVASILLLVFVMMAWGQAGVIWRWRRYRPVPPEIKAAIVFLLQDHKAQVEQYNNVAVGDGMQTVWGSDYDWSQTEIDVITQEIADTDAHISAINALP